MRSIGLLLAALGVAFAVACQAPAAAPASPAGGAGTTAAPAATAAAPKAAATPAGPSGVLRFGATGLTRTLDPLSIVGTPTGGEPGMALAEPLVQIKRDGSLEGVLAERWIAPTDGLTWQFKLRPNTRWSDGTPVTVQDVKFTFDKFLDPASGYSQAARIISFFDRTEATDATTFTIRTRTPDAILPRRIASIVILQQKSYEEIGQQRFTERSPIGSGPFKVQTFESGVRLVLEANPNAWRQPKLQTIEFRGIAEEAVRLGAVRTGELEAAAVIPESAIALRGEGKQIHTLQNASNTAIIVDSASPDAAPALKDRRVREALNISIDRVNLVRALTEGFGRPSSVAVAPEANGYVDLPMYPYDVNRARQLVRDAGFEGTTLKLSGVFGSGAGLATLTGVTAITQQMSQSGIRIEMENLESGVFLQRYSGGGLGPLMIFPLGAAGNDADGAILNFRTETNVVRPTIRYTNPEFDRVYLASRVEFDENRRRQLLGDALRILYNDYALIPVGNTPSIYALQPKVQDFNPNGTFNWNFPEIRVTQ